MKTHRWILPVMLGLLGSGPARAADAQVASLRDMSLADMLEIDIGTGTNKFVRQAPAVAYLITGEDISRLGARNLLEVLQSVPGFYLYNVRAEVNEPVADMRGGFSERGGQVLFMLDGRPLRLQDGVTMPEILRLPVNLVERIEVVRGPISALYGADALTGAVNIITKKHPNEAGLGAGSLGQRSAWAGKSGSFGVLDWSVNTSYARTREELPTRVIHPPQQLAFTQAFERDYRDLTVRLALGDWSAVLWALDYEKHETGDVRNPRPMVVGDSLHRHAQLNYQTEIDANSQFKASYLHTEHSGASIALLRMNIPTDGSNAEVHDGVEASYTRQLLQAHRLRASAGSVREQRDQGLSAPNPRYDPRFTHFLMLQDEFAFAPNWELTAGMRVDRYSDVGSVRNPRAGLVWNASERLTTKLLWGQAFRPPVVGDSTAVVAPPPLPGQPPPPPPPVPSTPAVLNTLPERMQNTELAFDFRPTENVRAALNIYRYSGHDLFVAGGGQPPGGRDGHGGELELSWLATPIFRVEASASMARVSDSATGLQVAFTPTRSAKLGLDWSVPHGWAANLRWEAYWDRSRGGARDARPALDTLSLVNGTLRRDLSTSTTFVFAVHNLLNQRSYVPILNQGYSDDIQVAARSLMVQFEKHF
ncbi:MAG: TonB-dependent receptor [Pseudomonadota bacterium]